jgi:sugar phosphate isomerase/epimerase
MTRRTFVIAAAAAGATPALAVPSTKMGIAITSYLTVRKPRDTYEFLEYCHSLGAGGIQASLTSMEPEYLKKIRTRAEEWGMYIEVMASLPKKDDNGAFERTVSAAKETGAMLVRAACLGGRRYETFSRLADWQSFITDSRAAITRALAVVEKHRLPLALENHKDWVADEMAALMKDKSSEYLGVCLDTGNNIALLDDPMMVVEKLAPFTLSTHIKDMGVEPYSDGFLLSELPLGEGILDMRKIVSTIHKARPDARMTLEMITRNPLEIPCLTEKYWVTFPERNGWYLAKTLVMVRNASRRIEPLPRIDRLNPAAQLRLEEDNVKQCLHYAREQLGL